MGISALGVRCLLLSSATGVLCRRVICVLHVMLDYIMSCLATKKGGSGARRLQFMQLLLGARRAEVHAE